METEFSTLLRQHADLKRINYEGPTKNVMYDSMYSPSNNDKDGGIYCLVITSEPITKLAKSLRTQEQALTNEYGYIQLDKIERN